MEDVSFQHMIKVPKQHNIPTHWHSWNTVIHALCEKRSWEIVKELFGTSYVALTPHGFTSRATECFLNVTACYISSEWEIKSTILQTCPFYKSHRYGQLSEEEWKLKRVNCSIPICNNVKQHFVCLHIISYVVLCGVEPNPWRELWDVIWLHSQTSISSNEPCFARF